MILRPALPEDFQTLTNIWIRAEELPEDTAVSVPTVLPHMSATGMLVVAEVGGRIVGFGSSFTRSNVRFMGQLFIDPLHQSGGVGAALMRAVMPVDGAELTTIASPDRRAVALYTRHGMFPLWPVYGMAAERGTLRGIGDSGIDMIPGDGNDPKLAEIDAGIGGRHRPEDLEYLIAKRGGAPFWLMRGGETIGYCILQVMKDGADELDDTETVRVGPLGVNDAADMADCIRAAVTAALGFGSKINVLAPGPGDAFRTLLDAGFQVQYYDTFMSASRPPFVDALRYVPGSGGMY